MIRVIDNSVALITVGDKVRCSNIRLKYSVIAPNKKERKIKSK